MRKGLIGVVTIIVVLMFVNTATSQKLYCQAPIWGLEGLEGFTDALPNDIPCPTYIENWYDARYYHESHPDADIMQQRGGWKIALAFEEPFIDPETQDFSLEYQTELVNTANGDRYVGTPWDCYTWLDRRTCEAGFWLGHNLNAEGVWEFKVNSYTVAINETNMEIPKIPVIKIHRMKFTRDGNHIRIKYSAPEMEGAHVRLRFFEGENCVFQMRSDRDDFEMGHRKNLLLPVDMTGMIGRFEYRAPEGVGRTVLWFKLPE